MNKKEIKHRFIFPVCFFFLEMRRSNQINFPVVHPEGCNDMLNVTSENQYMDEIKPLEFDIVKLSVRDLFSLFW